MPTKKLRDVAKKKYLPAVAVVNLHGVIAGQVGGKHLTLKMVYTFNQQLTRSESESTFFPFLKVARAPGWGANPGSVGFSFIYFPSLIR
jgi:hypothetical protein